MEATRGVLSPSQESGGLLSVICVSLNLSMPCGPLKWSIKIGSIMVVILALTFNHVTFQL